MVNKITDSVDIISFQNEKIQEMITKISSHYSDYKEVEYKFTGPLDDQKQLFKFPFVFDTPSEYNYVDFPNSKNYIDYAIEEYFEVLPYVHYQIWSLKEEQVLKFINKGYRTDPIFKFNIGKTDSQCGQSISSSLKKELKRYYENYIHLGYSDLKGINKELKNELIIQNKLIYFYVCQNSKILAKNNEGSLVDYARALFQCVHGTVLNHGYYSYEVTPLVLKKALNLSKKPDLGTWIDINFAKQHGTRIWYLLNLSSYLIRSLKYAIAYNFEGFIANYLSKKMRTKLMAEKNYNGGSGHKQNKTAILNKYYELERNFGSTLSKSKIREKVCGWYFETYGKEIDESNIRYYLDEK